MVTLIQVVCDKSNNIYDLSIRVTDAFASSYNESETNKIFRVIEKQAKATYEHITKVIVGTGLFIICFKNRKHNIKFYI